MPLITGEMEARRYVAGAKALAGCSREVCCHSRRGKPRGAAAREYHSTVHVASLYDKLACPLSKRKREEKQGGR